MCGASTPYYVYAIDCSYLSKCAIVIVDINECSIHPPCENGAICIDSVDGSTCACAAGYTGKNCESGDSLGFIKHLYFLLDRLRRCIQLFVSTETTSSHEFTSQFGIAFFIRENTHKLAKSVSPARVFI